MSNVSIPYIDMALLDGSTKSRADPYGTDEATAVRWTQRVTRGLQLCHERRLLHRDVKPDNILVNQTGDALLGDFGVTAMMAADGSATAHGDPEICAPEVFGGRCTVQSDVYSLGVTLYHLVAGRYPHRFADYGRNVATFADAVRTGLPDVREGSPHVTVSLARVIRKATALDPALRYPSAADLDAALAGLRPAKRTISEVPPCTGAIRCWHAGPGHRQTVRPIHVCTTPSDGRTIRIETRHVGGNKIAAHCTQTTPAQLSGRLRAVFRDLH